MKLIISLETIDSTFYEPKRSSMQYSNNCYNMTFWMTTLFSWRGHSKLSKALYSHQSASRSMAQTEAKKVSSHKSAFPRNLQGSSIHLIRIYFKLGYSLKSLSSNPISHKTNLHRLHYIYPKLPNIWNYLPRRLGNSILKFYQIFRIFLKFPLRHNKDERKFSISLLQIVKILNLNP